MICISGVNAGNIAVRRGFALHPGSAKARGPSLSSGEGPPHMFAGASAAPTICATTAFMLVAGVGSSAITAP